MPKAKESNVDIAKAIEEERAYTQSRAGKKWRITPQVLNKVYRGAKAGLSKTALAEYLGISRSTMTRAFNNDERICSAYSDGKSADLAELMGVLRQHAMKGSFQHLAGYMRTAHKIDISEQKQELAGVQIVVQLPFGQNNAPGTTVNGEIEQANIEEKANLPFSLSDNCEQKQ